MPQFPIEAHEYTTNGGATWTRFTAGQLSRVVVGNVARAAGEVGVRVAANGSVPAGDVLWNDRAFTVASAQLQPPALQEGIGTTHSKVVLTWDTPAGRVSTLLQRATDAAFTANVVTLYNGMNGGFTDTDVAPSTTYYYRAQHIGNGSSSLTSSPANLTVLTPLRMRFASFPAHSLQFPALPQLTGLCTLDLLMRVGSQPQQTFVIDFRSRNTPEAQSSPLAGESWGYAFGPNGGILNVEIYADGSRLTATEQLYTGTWRRVQFRSTELRLITLLSRFSGNLICAADIADMRLLDSSGVVVARYDFQNIPTGTDPLLQDVSGNGNHVQVRGVTVSSFFYE